MQGQTGQKAQGRAMGLSIAALLVGMLSIQLGAAIAKGLFPLLGAAGTASLRILFAALFLAIALTPWKVRPTRATIGPLLLYGLVLGLMNLSFYKALATIPLGLAVAIEFIGPLGVAIAFSRRRVDLLWAGLAVTGLFLLLPFGIGDADTDPVGIGWALGAGLCWALYILAGKRTSQDHGYRAAALGMAIGALAILPAGVAVADRVLAHPQTLLFVAAVALLSSALPYTLEMIALRHVPAGTFGTLMSLEPALGALAGAIWLREHLPLTQWIAIAAIMAASAGATWTASRMSGAPTIPTEPT